MGSLQLKIITPTNILFEGEINSVDLPGEKGRFTVLKNHGDIISLLDKGTIKVVDKGGNEQLFDCDTGSVECLNNNLTVLIEDGKLIETT